MPINVDWLGDGWIYFTEEERKRMTPRKQGQWFDPTDIKSFTMPADENERLELVMTGAASLDAMVLPLSVVAGLVAHMRKGKVDPSIVDDLERILAKSEQAARVTKVFRNCGNN